jgi:hypothetical protein
LLLLARTARLGEAGKIGGFGQFRRFVEQGDQRLQLDPRRPLGGEHLGTGDRMERAGLHRVEPDLRVLPLAVADRLEHRAIALALRCIELIRNAISPADRGELGVAGGLRAGVRPGGQSRHHHHGRSKRQRQLAGHADIPPISNCRSFQASAFAAGFSIRKRG